MTVGTFLGIRNGRSLVIGALCDISLDTETGDRPGMQTTGRVDLLGEILADKSGAGYFQRGVMNYPKIGSAIVPIDHRELRIIFDISGAHTINVGHLQQDASLGAYINVDDMVRKHFAIFGSTGAGKSSAVALILREIMDAGPDLRMLLIDPHNEYGASFEDRAHVVRPGNLRLPYWLFNFDEIVEVIFGRRPRRGGRSRAAGGAHSARQERICPQHRGAGSELPQSRAEGGRYTVDTPVPYRIDQLVALAEARMGKLENHAVAVQYQRLLLRLNTVRKNPATPSSSMRPAATTPWSTSCATCSVCRTTAGR